MSDRNYEVMTVEGGKHVKTWTRGVQFEVEAVEQVANIARMPFVYPHVAVMPDVHWGMGATVGSVIPTLGAVIPAAVGVDIGCGMMAVRLPLQANQLPDNLSTLRSNIERMVPHGRTGNGAPGSDRGAWGNVRPETHDAYEIELDIGWQQLVKEYPKVDHKSMMNHLGTLGGGNHFIEVCIDEANDVWVVLHSGSRGVGNRIGSYFIELAKEDMKRYFINLPDENLAYLPEGSLHFNGYIKAVSWAQNYARVNRELMMNQVLAAFQESFGWWVCGDTFAKHDTVVQCHHNYVTREAHGGRNVLLTRKGAVCARKGVMGIIPGSMGARSYIVRGKGNEDSLNSCSHGAGRAMSRNEARKRFTLEDHAKATVGIECRKDAEVIDETPGAYKDVEAVMRAQSDLVEIIHTLHQVVCVKG